jgi:hypothetical protein
MLFGAFAFGSIELGGFFGVANLTLNVPGDTIVRRMIITTN